MCACMYVCICVHMHVSIHLSKDVYFKESVHAVVGAAKSEICRSCWRPREKLTLQSGGRTASSLGHINLYLKTFKLIGWQLPSTLWREINCTQSPLISMFITSKKYPNTWTCVWSNIWAPEPSQVDTENEPSQMPSQKSGIRKRYNKISSSLALHPHFVNFPFALTWIQSSFLSPCVFCPGCERRKAFRNPRPLHYAMTESDWEWTRQNLSNSWSALLLGLQLSPSHRLNTKSISKELMLPTIFYWTFLCSLNSTSQKANKTVQQNQFLLPGLPPPVVALPSHRPPTLHTCSAGLSFAPFHQCLTQCPACHTTQVAEWIHGCCTQSVVILANPISKCRLLPFSIIITQIQARPL